MTDDFEDENSDARWTPGARERLTAAGAALIESIQLELATLNYENAEPDDASMTVRANLMETSAIEYAGAYIEYTGQFHPFGFLETFDEITEGDDWEPAQPGEIVSVLMRADFRITDEDIVLRAGRKLFLEQSGDEGGSSADSLGVGASIYQMIHAHGHERLNHTDGLEPLGAITQVIVPEEVIDFSSEIPELLRPNQAFGVGGELLYGAEDRWGS
jgi:hypothetical protein